MTVPIIPGDAEPVTLSSVMPASKPPSTTPRWVVPVIAGMAVLLVAAGVSLYLATRHFGPAASPAASPTSTPIRDAYFGCGQVGEVSDQDHTIVLDTLGGNLTKATAADVNCILQHLGAPNAIYETMLKTRAIDGRQRGQWSTFEASWTYHPDHGLNVIIHDSAGS